MSVICAISIACPRPRPSARWRPFRCCEPSFARDPGRRGGCPLSRMVAMAHRARRWHLRFARAFALVAIAALADVREQKVRRGIGLIGRVAAGALLVLVLLVIEPAVDEIARRLRDRHDLERPGRTGGRMAFAA